jgi:formamidopyrimidine-DNA glycosylase
LRYWQAIEKGPLRDDPFNRFIHFVFSFTNGKHLVFSDSRKFGKITLLETKSMHQSKHLKNLGPEPLEKNFNLKKLKECLNKKIKTEQKIKNVLLDQSILVGIGNIYASEILWYSDIHPERKIYSLQEKDFELIFKNIKKVLALGLKFRGNSISDYRDVNGEIGKFQLHQKAYWRGGEKCQKKIQIKGKQKFCPGIILEKNLNNRNSYFCSVHQK